MAHLLGPAWTFTNYLKSFPITIILSLQLVLLSKFAVASVCNETNKTQQGKYQTNLQNLFTNFTSMASSLNFYNSTSGKSPDKAYALYLCLGDASSDVCHSCVAELIDSISTNGCSDGFGYRDKCMLHYANYDFFGKVEYRLGKSDGSDVNASNVEGFDLTLDGMLLQLISDTAGESAGLYATREASVGGEGQGKLTGLAQCTQDIDRGNCTGCLKMAYSNLAGCCGSTTYSWARYSSCQMRFELVSSGANSICAAWTLLGYILFHWLLC